MFAVKMTYFRYLTCEIDAECRQIPSNELNRHGHFRVKVRDTAGAGLVIDPLWLLRVVVARVLLDERRGTLLLLAHLLLLHDRASLFLVCSSLSPQAALCQVASQVDLHRGPLHDRFSLICRHIVLNGVFEGLTLTLDAAFHLPAQLLIDLEILDLELGVPLFLRIDELGRHVVLRLRVIVHYRMHIMVGKVRNASIEMIFLNTTWLLSLHKIIILVAPDIPVNHFSVVRQLSRL